MRRAGLGDVGGYVRRWTRRIILGWLLLTFGTVLALRWLDPPISAFMIGDRLDVWFGSANYPLRFQWVPWTKISPAAKLAVIASEDQKFPEHFGFDFSSIANAMQERENGERVRGASTITQQVAKNLFLWPRQSWLRKGIEAYLTVVIEICWPKRRILEVYLNVAEFGPGVYGVGAASPFYLRKSAAALTTSDGARLASVLPNPTHWRVNAPTAYLKRRAAWIERQMRHLGSATLQRVRG